MINQKLAKVELFLKLQEHGVIATGNITNIKKLYREKGIPLVETDKPKIQPGWEEKQKGMLQVLWEHGWINVEHIVKTLKRKKLCCRQWAGSMESPLTKHQNITANW